MGDNKTPHKAAVYDGQVRQTIPEYELFIGQVIDLISVCKGTLSSWLDTGCGTGTLVTKALNRFKETSFILADPSDDMLNIAKNKFDENKRLKFIASGSLELDLPSDSIDVLTAIMCHHYFDNETRKKAVKNCYRMLNSGGVYITFENIRPFSEQGTKIGLERWKKFQLDHGKSEESVKAHLKRFDTEFFPITVKEHLQLLRETGFAVCEILWVSYMQAGFYAIKQ